MLSCPGITERHILRYCCLLWRDSAHLHHIYESKIMKPYPIQTQWLFGRGFIVRMITLALLIPVFNKHGNVIVRINPATKEVALPRTMLITDRYYKSIIDEHHAMPRNQRFFSAPVDANSSTSRPR